MDNDSNSRIQRLQAQTQLGSHRAARQDWLFGAVIVLATVIGLVAFNFG